MYIKNRTAQNVQSDLDLTLSQTTNFRLSQTQRLCRRQFQLWWKWQQIFQKGRKRCGKRRNCSLRAISSFPAVFFDRLILQTRKNQGLFGKGLKRLQTPCKLPKRAYFRPGSKTCAKYYIGKFIFDEGDIRLKSLRLFVEPKGRNRYVWKSGENSKF